MICLKPFPGCPGVVLGGHCGWGFVRLLPFRHQFGRRFGESTPGLPLAEPTFRPTKASPTVADHTFRAPVYRPVYPLFVTLDVMIGTGLGMGVLHDHSAGTAREHLNLVDGRRREKGKERG
jgi:hypothetical protein